MFYRKLYEPYSLKKWAAMAALVLLFVFLFGCFRRHTIPGPGNTPIHEERLISELSSDDPSVRWNAAANLGVVRYKGAVPALINSLRDENWQVRLLSAWALGRIGDSRATKALGGALKDPCIDVRPFAVWAMGELRNPEAVSVLADSLFSLEETGTRTAVIGALGKIGDPSAVPVLLKALKDEDEDVRAAAAAVLPVFGDKSAIPPLIKTLDDRDSMVVINALVSLEKMRATEALGKIRRLEGDPERLVRFEAERAVRVLSGSGSFFPDKNECDLALEREKEIENRSMPDLSIGDMTDLNPEDSFNPSTLPIKLGRRVDFDRAVEDLYSDSPTLRSEAAWTLGNSGDVRAVPHLLKLMKDPSSNVRWNVVKALGKLKDPAALDPLMEALDDPDKDVREDVVEALGRLGDEKALPGLASVFEKEKHAYIRAKTAEALGGIKGKKALELIKKALEDPSPEVRTAAVITLGLRGGDESLSILLKARNDENEVVRKAAAAAEEVIRGGMEPSELKEMNPFER